ncbi:MAG: tetratricopeptide repeat protein [Parvibaculum sp.]|nr:tetratricopeptide repeat protein [Parvibaculum sp.]
MIFRTLSLFLLAAALSAPGAGAAPEPQRELAPEGAPPSSEGKAEAREVLLDKLLGELAEAEDEEAGRALERAIQSVWLSSGSPSIDLLMGRGLDALREDDIDRAYFYFDEVVTLAPGFAEGWHKRAAIHYLREDYAAALADLEQALRLEPRHYEALAGLGVILEDLGDRKGALEAYRRALKLDPWLENGATRIAPLELEVEGRGI